MIVYLAIPENGQTKEAAHNVADMIAAGLSKKGHKVCSPFNHYHGKDATYEDKLSNNINCVLHCDAVYYAPGWGLSTECSIIFSVVNLYNKEREKQGLKPIISIYGKEDEFN